MAEVRQHPCTVCNHPDRGAIETAILNGRAMRDVCRQFGIGSGVFGTDTFKPDHKKLERHAGSRDGTIRGHMAEAYQEVMAGRLAESGQAIVSRLEQLHHVTEETMARLRAGTVVEDAQGPVLDPAKPGEYLRRFDNRGILAAVREARANIEVEARLAGALPDGDPDAAEHARAGLESPEVRSLIAQAEAHLAQQATA